MNNLVELWTEKEIIEKFGLTSREGKSRQIGHWIRKGLKYIRISDKRLFREEDVVAYFNKLAEKGSSGD